MMLALADIAQFLSQLGSDEALDLNIPLVDVSLAEAMDFGTAFTDQVINPLYNEDGSLGFCPSAIN